MRMQLTARKFLRYKISTMITKTALPPPDFIQSVITELKGMKNLDELKHLGSANRIRVWEDDASSMRVSTLMKIAEYGETLNLESIRYWKDLLYADHSPAVHLQNEWHEPHTSYVCKRKLVEPGDLIVHAGELCEYLGVNDKGRAQARSRHNEQIYELDALPTHVVIGKLTPITTEE